MITIIAIKAVFADTSKSTGIDTDAVTARADRNVCGVGEVIGAASNYDLTGWNVKTCFSDMIPGVEIVGRMAGEEVDLDRDGHVASGANADDARSYSEHV